MSQRLGLIDASHQVYLDPANIDDQYYAASHDIPGNDFHGTETTRSVYLNETRSALHNLHFTAAGRYNKTTVSSDLYVRTDSDGIAELRSTSKILDQLLTQQTHTQESFDYSSFNPEFGINYLPVKSVNLYGNISRGARVPSVVELGCAFDATPVDISVGNLPGTAPRSLIGRAVPYRRRCPAIHISRRSARLRARSARGAPSVSGIGMRVCIGPT